MLKLLLAGLIVICAAEPGADPAAGPAADAGAGEAQVRPVKDEPARGADAGDADAPDPEDEAAAGAHYRDALLNAVTPGERVQALEQVVKDHPKSRWADDALWVLGEAARQGSRHDLVVYYWHALVAAYPRETDPGRGAVPKLSTGVQYWRARAGRGGVSPRSRHRVGSRSIGRAASGGPSGKTCPR